MVGLLSWIDSQSQSRRDTVRCSGATSLCLLNKRLVYFICILGIGVLYNLAELKLNYLGYVSFGDIFKCICCLIDRQESK